MRSLPAVAAVCVVVGSCSEPAGPERLEPGLTFLAAPEPDTIGAFVDEPFLIRAVAADGAPAAGVDVRFVPVKREQWVPHGEFPPHPTLYLQLLEEDGFYEAVTIPTDEEGVAGVRVRRGFLAGTAGLEVSVPAIDAVDTLFIEVLPGQPVGLWVSPQDTATLLGRGYPLAVRLRDATWNLSAVEAALSADPPVTLRNDSVIGAAYGRAEIHVQAGTFSATVRTTVVPDGVLAASHQAVQGGDFRLALMRTDGSEFGYLAEGAAESLAWAPAGDVLVFASGSQPWPFLVGLDGAEPERLTITNPLEEGQWDPVFSRDAACLYLSGMPLSGHYPGEGGLYRIPAAGGTLERIGPDAGPALDVDVHPDVDPSGSRLAHATSRVAADGLHIRILNLGTGAIDSVDVEGSRPRWSPDGELIAFIREGEIHLIRPDGSDPRSVTTGTAYEWIDWSPDGVWLAASTPYGPARTDLVRVQDGLRLPLPFGYRLFRPRWRP